MKRRISVQTDGIFQPLGVDEGMRQISRAGIDCVDLDLIYISYSSIRKGIIEGEFTLPEERFMEEVIRPIRDAGRKYGVGFGQAHAPFPSWIPENEEMNAFLMRAFRMCLDACRFLDCPYLVIHPAFNDYRNRLDAGTEHDINIRLYSELIPDAKRTGVKILLENMFVSWKAKRVEAICADMGEACAYIDELNAIAGEEIFGFCYDCGHAALLGKDQGKAIRTLGHRILALHLHDNDGVNDSHRFPYYGIIDWETLLRALRDIGYSGTLNFETSNEMDAHDPALIPKLLELLGETGRLFASKMDGEDFSAV